MTSLQLTPRGPFSLAMSKSFLEGFIPTSHSTVSGPTTVSVAFRLDESYEAVGATLEQRPDGVVTVTLTGAPTAAAAARAGRQVARLFSLDHDGTDFPALGRREPALGVLMDQYPGFRPVCFASPYEAGVWGLLAQRVPMKVASGLERKVAIAHGDTLSVDGRDIPVFPGPARLLALDGADGVPSVKWERLQGLARATLDGRLDAERLRALPPEEALEQLSALPGVGAWTAAHILLRGAAPTDQGAFEEPRVRRAIMLTYGLDREPSEAELERLTQAWRPFRTWATVLAAFHLSRSGHWSDAPRGRGRPSPRGAAPRSKAPARRAPTRGR